MKTINSYSEFQPLEEIVVGRGYPPEYVDFVEDLEIRENLQKIFIEIEEDFQNFIYPQRDKSDIIINFFTNVEFTLDDIDKESDIYLKIFISKKYPLIDILSNLSKKEIKFQIDSESDENFNKITFYEFKECDILGDYYHLNNYYDYIMFFILSLQQRN